jgi:putative ABC transport system permease protein
VVFVAVFAAGLKSSIGSQIDNLVRAQLIVYSQGFQPFSSRTEKIVANVPGVRAAVGTPFDQLQVNGHSSNSAVDVLIGMDPAKILDVYKFDWIDGSDSLVSQLGPGKTLIEEQFAKEHHLQVGDSYRVVTPDGGHARLTAIGEYRDPTVLQGSMASLSTLRSVSPARDPLSLLVAVDDPDKLDQVQAAIKDALKPYPTLKVQNKGEYQQTLNDQLNQIVYLLYALLAFSVVISLFGIANSLFLSIHERTREIALLRAVGATVDQVRRVIRYESVITAVIGGLLGTGIGILFAFLLIQSLSEFGFSISIPVGQLLIFMVLALVVGVVGAIAPARRASRVDVLEAIHQE